MWRGCFELRRRLAEDEVDIPIPRSINYHRANPDFADGVWALIEVDTAKYDGRTEKINITLPRRLLAKIDNYAKQHHQTRSGFLAEAARTAMKSPTQ
ncbi:type II toxin-antitoxin system HicB family antitoxin [Alcaligenaceae bacterium]|nr:type II toxin-antitoxin system HicB family antitoxin [Alcaligenaceae bacterium]